MDHDHTTEAWVSLGATDPDWGVLTERGRRHGGWAGDLDEFYASGRTAIVEVLSLVPRDVVVRRALDFGCGTGRLTLALAERGIDVTAIDVAPGMLDVVRKRVTERGFDNVHPTLTGDYRPQSDHDVALSLLVLQHLPNVDAVHGALRTMVSGVRPAGILVVEIPDRAVRVRARLQPRLRAYRMLRRLGAQPEALHKRGLSGISMLTVAEERVRRMFGELDAEVLGVTRWSDAGHRYARYVARRNHYGDARPAD